ncbi:MAG: DUF2239 family protein [Gemmatimonadales bacterium]
MNTAESPLAIAFEGARQIGAGPLPQVAIRVKRVVERGERGPVLVFDLHTSEPIEFDLRGTEGDLLGRLASRLAPPAAGPDAEVGRLEPPARPTAGRPKLGVVAREVTLLPRHWDWLAGQPGGASVTLRRLVDQARQASGDDDRIRQAREATYRFLVAMAGNRPGFEEALRALFAGDRPRFDRLVARWPAAIRSHAKALMARSVS